jgi:hypothetical protein
MILMISISFLSNYNEFEQTWCHGANGSDPRMSSLQLQVLKDHVVTLPYEALHVVDEHVTYTLFFLDEKHVTYT